MWVGALGGGGSGGSGGGGLTAFGAWRGDVFSSVVLLDLDKVLLSMGADLDDVFGADVRFDLFPGSTVLFEGVEKKLVLFIGPVFSVFGNNVLFARLLVGGGSWGGGGLFVSWLGLGGCGRLGLRLWGGSGGFDRGGLGGRCLGWSGGHWVCDEVGGDV